MPREVVPETGVIDAHGGILVDRLVDALSEDLKAAPAIRLNDADAITLFNIATGCYSPLTGFLGRDDYESVVAHQRLTSGVAWTVPILLRVSEEIARSAKDAGKLRLDDGEGRLLGTLDVGDVFEIDTVRHCRQVFLTEDAAHPGVVRTLAAPPMAVGGTVSVLRSVLPVRPMVLSPRAHRSALAMTGGTRFVSFSTRNVGHLGHEHLHSMVLEWADVLGINIISGAMLPGSFLTDVVLDAYDFMARNYYPSDRVILNEMRLPPIYAGPREAFLQATVLQNLGYTHFIVGRDHAGIGRYYPRYGSQQIFRDVPGLAIEVLPFAEPRYCGVCAKITSERSCRHPDDKGFTFNGRDVRRLLLDGKIGELDGVMRKEVVEFLLAMLKGGEGRPPRALFHE